MTLVMTTPPCKLRLLGMELATSLLAMTPGCLVARGSRPLSHNPDDHCTIAGVVP